MDPNNHCFRGGSKLSDSYISRPTKFHDVKLRTHHGGYFVSHPTINYVAGKLEVQKVGWDIDEISAIEVSNYVKSLGYASHKCIWYMHPEFDIGNGLRPLNKDTEVLQFAHDVKDYEYVDIYVEHLIDTPVVGECEAELGDKDVEVVKVKVVGGKHVEQVVNVQGRRKKIRESEFGQEKEKVIEWVSEVPREEDDDSEDGDTVNHETNSESDDSYYDANQEEEDNVTNVSLDDSDYDEQWDWTSILPLDTLDPQGTHKTTLTFGKEENPQENGGGSVIKATIASRNLEPTIVADFVNEDCDLEELDSPPLSDKEELVRPKFPKFKMPEDTRNIQFEVGLIFNSKDLVKDAMKEYAMSAKKNVHLVKNDKTRMVIRCIEGCPFYVRVSKSSFCHYFQVVRCNLTHTCHRTANNRQAKTSWLSKKFVAILRYNPDMKTKGLIAEAKERWGVVLTRHQAYNAKKNALEIIQGASNEQYKHLRSYAEELRRSNPNSTVIIKCGMGCKGPIFERIYVCFEACKAAFGSSCRPLIGLDGCFLKGVYGGQLLAAVGKDGNNQMLPIAFAVVEAETKESWSWFVNLLMEDLGGVQHKRWSFISDQQKGLVPTLQNIYENVEHRLCMKHLYANWRKKYPGIEMKEALWKAARANIVPEWHRAMEFLKKLNEQAWKDMMDIPPQMWSRSAYSTHTQCDLQGNNMCEAFNKAILEYRDKPIINLIEGLKFYITNRFVSQRDMMVRYNGNICPLIQLLLEKIKKDADGWTPNWAGDDAYALFEVSRDVDQYIVNLSNRSCSCRKWDLS